MTREQAAAALNEAYPGKRHYVACYQWSRDGKVDVPTFDVCVYDVLPDVNASGHATTLHEAVEAAIRNNPAAKEADAMFASV